MSHTKSKQSVRKRVVNIRLLIATLISVTVVSTIAFFWYRYQLTATSNMLLVHAEEMEQQNKWGKATAFYQRYLLLNNDDTEVLVKLIHSYSKGQKDYQRTQRLINLLNKAIQQLPDRSDLRQMLADNHLLAGQLFLAIDQAVEVAKRVQGDQTKRNQAEKVIALANYQLAQDKAAGRHELKEEYSERKIKSLVSALTDLYLAAEQNPSDLQLVEITANALLSHLELLLTEEMRLAELDLQAAQPVDNPIASADPLFDKLIESNPSNADALLARFSYRMRRRAVVTQLLDLEQERNIKLSEKQLGDLNNHVEDLSLIVADLNAAHEADPTHADALLQLGLWSAVHNQDFELAESRLNEALKIRPTDGRIYLALGELLSHQNKQDDSVAVLRQGHKLASNERLKLDTTLADKLIESGQLDTAANILDDLDSQFAIETNQLNSEEKTEANNKLRLLHARLLIARGQFQDAIDFLESVLATSRNNSSVNESAEVIQAKIIYVRELMARQRWEKASSYCYELVEALPKNSMVVLSAAQCALKAGNPTASVGFLEDYLQQHSAGQGEPSANSELSNIYVLLVQARLAEQLQRPASRRDWSQFENIRDQAKSYAPNRWEISIADLNHELAKFTSISTNGSNSTNSDEISSVTRDIANKLQEIASTFPNNANVWQQITLAYQKLGLLQDSQRAFNQYQKIETSAASVAELKAVLLAEQQQFDESEQVLSEASSKLSGNERQQIELSRIKLLVKTQRTIEALQAIKPLIDSKQANPPLIFMGIEIAIKAEELKSAQDWLERIGDNPLYLFERNYVQASLLLASYQQRIREGKQVEPNEIRTLANLVQSLRQQKPQWYVPAAMLAKIYDLQGNSDSALKQYEDAVDLGDLSAETTERLVSLLAAKGNLSEAKSRLENYSADHDMNSRLELAEISVISKLEGLQNAIDMAQRGIEAGSQDPMKHIVLANLYMRDGQPTAAEQAARKATEQFPDDHRSWTALFGLLIEIGKPEEAKAILPTMSSKLNMSSSRREFVLAQAYAQLGDLQQAKSHYEQSLETDPTDVMVRLNYAKMLVSTDRIGARKQYTIVIDDENAKDGFKVEARRSLAQLLVDSGSKEDEDLAIKLLQSESNSDGTTRALDDRLRAYLLTKMGKTRADRLKNLLEAKRILKGAIEKEGTGEDSDSAKLLLTKVYEQQSQLGITTDEDNIDPIDSARELFRDLVDKQVPTNEQLRFSIEFLLRHAKPTIQTASSSGNEVARQSQFLNDAERQLAELERMQQRPEGKGPQSREEFFASEIANLRLKIRWLQLTDQIDQAAEELQDFATNRASTIPDTESGKRELGQLYATVGSMFTTLEKHADAEIWYRKLVDIYPNMYAALVSSLVEQDRLQDAVDICLEAINESDSSTRPVIALLQVLSNGKHTLPNQAELEGVIMKKLEANSNDVGLLMAAAVWKVSVKRNDHAITLFRRVVEISPRNTVAMNNLATLLAETTDGLEEALQTITRAIDIGGNSPPLLDTLGTIHLKSNNADLAIDCLEEATVSGAMDPRYFYHLAAAYELKGNNAEAIRNLQLAREYGLGDALLTDDDRAMLARLESRIGVATRVNQ